jgi:hypothetical protein
MPFPNWVGAIQSTKGMIRQKSKGMKVSLAHSLMLSELHHHLLSMFLVLRPWDAEMNHHGLWLSGLQTACTTKPSCGCQLSENRLWDFLASTLHSHMNKHLIVHIYVYTYIFILYVYVMWCIWHVWYIFLYINCICISYCFCFSVETWLIQIPVPGMVLVEDKILNMCFMNWFCGF